jgi:hypothetical protein
MSSYYEGLDIIIFEELDLVRLRYIWDVDGATCQDMIEIIFMLYLVKCTFWLGFEVVKLGLQLILMIDIWPWHFETYLCYDALGIQWLFIDCEFKL